MKKILFADEAREAWEAFDLLKNIPDEVIEEYERCRIAVRGYQFMTGYQGIQGGGMTLIASRIVILIRSTSKTESIFTNDKNLAELLKGYGFVNVTYSPITKADAPDLNHRLPKKGPVKNTPDRSR